MGPFLASGGPRALCAFVALAFALALASGCGDDSGADPDGGPAPDGGMTDAAMDDAAMDDAAMDDAGPPDGSPPEGCETLEACLNVLGVDTTPTPRVDPMQDALPDTYAPLGASASFGHADGFGGDSSANPTDELFIVNLRIPGVDSLMPLIEKRGVQVDGSGEVNSGGTAALHHLPNGDNPWVGDDSAHASDGHVGRARRDVTAGDVDGDGFEELVVVFVDESRIDPVLTVKVIDDQAQEFAEISDGFGSGEDVLDVKVATGDFDGDGAAEIAVGVSRPAGAELLVLTESAGDYVVETETTQSYEPTSEDGVLTLQLATGNLDYDNGEELALVLNELDASGSPPTGSATFFAYDDRGADFELLGSGAVTGEDPDVGPRNAVVADVDLGDVDGDGLDEVVLGGLTAFNGGAEDSYPYLVAVLDDAKRELAPLSGKVVDAPFLGNPAFDPWMIRFVHVNAFDLDGDGLDEIQANQVIMEDLGESDALSEIHRLPDHVFLESNSDAGAFMNAATFTVVSGDVTGDGREDLITYSQYQEDIRMFGKTSIDTVGDGGFVQWSQIVYTTTYFPGDTPRPILVPVNLDTDSPALKYSEGSYRLIFTEPIPIAALAAAPCSEGIGQNVGACATAFGRADSTTVSSEVTLSITTSAYVGLSLGLSVPWLGDFKADFKHKVTRRASFSTGHSYTVTKSEVFTTGALEDSVVFTTIPYDTYTYDVLSHPVDELVGGTVTVAVPREPLMIKAERGFYNAHLPEDLDPLGDDVFDHTVGALDSYPDAARKDMLLGTYGGLENGPQSVGQGTGSNGLAIDVSTAVSAGGALGIEVERSIDVTAGPVLAGFSIGAGVQASLQLTSGMSTTYGVTVGDLDAAHFDAHQYSYGIFTYVQDLDDHEFQVINFWVE